MNTIYVAPPHEQYAVNHVGTYFFLVNYTHTIRDVQSVEFMTLSVYDICICYYVTDKQHMCNVPMHTRYTHPFPRWTLIIYSSNVAVPPPSEYKYNLVVSWQQICVVVMFLLVESFPRVSQQSNTRLCCIEIDKVLFVSDWIMINDFIPAQFRCDSVVHFEPWEIERDNGKKLNVYQRK